MASKGPNLKCVSWCIPILILFRFVNFLLSYRGYLDKSVSLQLNKGRRVTGTLRGFDQFMNIVLGDAVDETPQKGASASAAAPSTPIGMVVRDPLQFIFLVLSR